MKKILLCMALAAVILSSCGGSGSKISVLRPRVEMSDNPVGIGTDAPRFMWQIASPRHDLVQQSYRITVAASEKDLKAGKNLLWDSGTIDSDNSLFIRYEGAKLGSARDYFWRVKVGTNQGESSWSEVQKFSTALLDESLWKAQWIGENEMSNPGETDSEYSRLAARYLRKEFEVKSGVTRAVLYISGLGSNIGYLNGKRISEDVFAPLPTWYPTSVMYNTYEVTHMLGKGSNTIGVTLGNGRYFGMRNPRDNGFGLPSLFAQLEIEYADGTRETVVSDASWRVTSKGPITANNEFDGEEYDARRELGRWCENGYEDSAWQAADIMPVPGGKMVAQPSPNLVVMDEIKPTGIDRRPDGRFIVDMGQNMVGWLKVELHGKAGSPVTMRFAETLKEDGDLYTDNLRSAKVTDIYTPAADGVFSWEPSFVYHGFRFVELTGLDSQPELSAFTGRVVYDKIETIGKFESSNQLMNRIHKNAYWGLRGNYRGMPTDCPQRDERMGWLGDRATGAYSESFIFYHNTLYNKWLQDIEESQNSDGAISDVSPAYWKIYNDDITWPSAWFKIADMLYNQFGDASSIHRHYAAMKKWMQHVEKVGMKDYIMTRDVYGDWCMPPESPEIILSKDPARITDGRILSTTVYYELLNLMCKFAGMTGNDADIPVYRDLAAKMKEAYNKMFFDYETGRYGNNTVTGNILSLRLGLVPEGYESKVFENIVQKTVVDLNGHISTGLMGIQHLMRGLTEGGRVDVAYKMVNNETYPSWGYMISKGATTIWELWNGDTADPAMNSGNHVMLLGDLLTWYYEDLAGIACAPDAVGFRKIEMAPAFPEGLDHVKASTGTVMGEVGSHWKRDGGKFSWEVTIPGNTSATVRIPEAMNIAEPAGEGIRSVSRKDGFWFIEIGSGNYTFPSE